MSSGILEDDLEDDNVYNVPVIKQRRLVLETAMVQFWDLDDSYDPVLGILDGMFPYPQLSRLLSLPSRPITLLAIPTMLIYPLTPS